MSSVLKIERIRKLYGDRIANSIQKNINFFKAEGWKWEEKLLSKGTFSTTFALMVRSSAVVYILDDLDKERSNWFFISREAIKDMFNTFEKLEGE